ncbi:MAG: hypothetical protein IKJ01_02275 [Lachnospiraceae bacterium]|nr:hypothetical protein [Lachnospiraceae bacterium]
MTNYTANYIMVTEEHKPAWMREERYSYCEQCTTNKHISFWKSLIQLFL